MADPPEDDGLDTYLPATTEAEKKLVRDAEERLANGKVVKFDPKRKRTKKAPPPPPPGGWPSWHARLARDDRGRIISDIDNVLVALRGAEELQLACVYDEMLNASMVTRAWPKVAELAADERPIPREVDDDDVTRLQQWLQRMGLRRVGREIVGQAIEHFARDRRQHPVREWLDSLVWDGKPRLDTWLFTYFGACAENNNEIEYVRFVSRMFPTSMVARVSFSGGKPKVTHGPFTETQEVLGGYWMIQVGSKEEAIEWASRCPLG